MAYPQVQAADTSANMSSSDSEARDSGDLLNGIGSTSSLTSTVSSIFSADTQARKRNVHSSAAMAALTPLTYPASSPGISRSPLTSSKPYHNSTQPDPSPLGIPVADAPQDASENASPRPSSPRERPQIMPPIGQAKGYRVVYDPLVLDEKDKEKYDKLNEKEKKGLKVKIASFGTESHQESPPPDPRLAIVGYTSGKAVPVKVHSKWRLRIAQHALKPYAYDKASTIGPAPPKQIVVHSFDPFTPESQLKSFFASFGDIAEFRNQTDPNTGSLLGICLIKYKDSKPVKGVSVSAANAAKRAEKEAHNGRIGLTQVKVERDREGRRCRRYIEIKLRREAARHALHTPSIAAESAASSTPVPPPPPPPPGAREEAKPVPANTPKAPKGPASKREQGKRERAAESEQPSTAKERDTGRSIVESEAILAKIKRKPYIFISRDSVPVLGSTVPHLKKRFKAYDWREIRVDKTGYFVIFDDSKRGEDETVRCFKECNNGPMFTYKMAMECQQYGNPDYVRSPSPETQAVQTRKKEEMDRLERWAAEDLEEEKKERAVDLDPVKGALELLQVELRNKIMDDIKSRIVTPTIHDCLEPARHVAKRQKLDLPDPAENENKMPNLLLNKASDTPTTTSRARNGRPLSHSKPLRPHDPNRGRQVTTTVYMDERRKRRPAARPAHARPLHYRLQNMYRGDDEDEEDSDDDRKTTMTRDTEDQESRPLSRASRNSTPVSVSDSIDVPTPPHKKRKLVHKEREITPEEQETFAPHHKELLGDLIQKIPERMATRELELVVSTLPRDSKFQERARIELHTRQRAKYDGEETPAPTTETTRAKPHASTTDTNMDQSENLAVKPVRKEPRRKRPKSKKQIFEEREAERAAMAAADDSQAMEDESQAEDRDIELGDAEPVIEEEEEEGEARPQVEWGVSTDQRRKTVEDDDDVFLDIDGWKHMIKDEEDMRFLQQALEDVSAADIGDVTLWTRKQKEIKALNVVEGLGSVSAAARILGYYVPNPTGCARTEGVKKIFESEKSKYLPHRIRVQKQREAREAQAQEDPTAAVEAAKAAAAAKLASTASSRSNRANNRRLVNDINLQKQNLGTTGAETDAIKFNALKKRKKHVKFDRSAIHGWGLYAMENIAFNDLIIEYVGEKVRQKVADLREIKYDKQGIGSSYLFRMVDDEIVDATKKGGIARFINHSCTPNCTAKIIKVDGTRRIVIYALKDIAKNEELTYDYKFEREYGSDDRIPCLCGSVGCKGFLN
ncbi:histone H3-K4 methyltransferase Set1 [Aureobasidium pullulans]|nr:histone H3-K4 methyltransferase Set1 [Aureobasidium pullulans]